MLEETQNRITLNDYQRIARGTDQIKDSRSDGLSFFLLGLFGEVGTLLSALKKKQRDKKAIAGYNEAILEEFGDVLWYFSNIASRAQISLSVLAQKLSRAFEDWDEVNDEKIGSFQDLESKSRSEGSPDSPEFEKSIIALAGKVGLLLNDVQLDRIANNRDVLSAHLVEIFRALIESAEIADIDLHEAAEYNIRKIHNRWPEIRLHTPLFDENFGPLERFPRRIEMHIFETERNGKTYVVQQCNGVNVGSQLTDNKMREDDYRFHDVFHMANAAILGWYPVLRALFKLKRKSQALLDEAQDGARAILIEEGVSTLIFQRALRLNYFESISSVDYTLLKMIPEFVHGYEVDVCPLWQWEKAILEGFEVFRKLRHFRRGIVTADLVSRSITFAEKPL